MQQNSKTLSLLSIPVIVAALGYFVDIYDLLLFSIVRVKSLHGLGLSDQLIASKGMLIISIQMVGLLIGGIIWGVMGDKKGRLSVLFGSIILYSIANIANGMVHNVTQYTICRFIAGIGLAGELGAGITLVSELISKEKRGIATSIVAAVGLTGAIAAFIVSSSFHWRVCYYVGGGLGLVLLLLRIGVFESGMYKNIQHATGISKGNFFKLFTNKQRRKKYILSILIGLPTWYVVGILISFSKEFGQAFGIKEEISPAKAVMVSYVAISIGDFLIGLLSQALKSRKKALYVFYGITILGLVLYFSKYNGSATSMYVISALLGFGTGFWAIFVTMAAEHFGTNLRATAATTVPNMVRGSLPLMTLLFNFLKPSWGFTNSAIITGVIVMVISVISVIMTEETFGKDLDYIEAV